MSALIFMPWYCIDRQEAVGIYELHPYQVGVLNPNLAHLSTEISAILSSYLERPFTSTDAAASRPELPIRNATIITQRQGALNQPEVETLKFILAFCGISNRDFRTNLYLCSENLNVIIQNFNTPISIPFDPLIGTPRKNGSSGTAFSPGLFREVKPGYIAKQQIGNYRIDFDSDVARCLWTFFKGHGLKLDAWEKNIFSSLFSYYNANTDGFTYQTECVYSQAAIERLFLGPDHSERNLVAAAISFISTKGINFAPFTNTNRNWQSITYKQQKKTYPSATIFEAWLRELTRLRNCFAHGNYSPAGPWVWTPHEHLLLSSFIYPLLLKHFISAFDPTSTYSISSADSKKMRVVERLLAEENYFSETSLNSGITRWGRIIIDSRLLP